VKGVHIFIGNYRVRGSSSQGRKGQWRAGKIDPTNRGAKFIECRVMGQTGYKVRESVTLLWGKYGEKSRG